MIVCLAEGRGGKDISECNVAFSKTGGVGGGEDQSQERDGSMRWYSLLYPERRKGAAWPGVRGDGTMSVGVEPDTEREESSRRCAALVSHFPPCILMVLVPSDIPPDHWFVTPLVSPCGSTLGSQLERLVSLAWATTNQQRGGVHELLRDLLHSWKERVKLFSLANPPAMTGSRRIPFNHRSHISSQMLKSCVLE